MDLNKGKVLVEIARKSVESHFSGNTKELQELIKSHWFLNKKRGVFVTIHTYPEKQLRGCIGFPLPIYPLGEAVVKAAKSAAFEDPRFPPLQEEELGKVIFEVSVLTEPEKIKYESCEELLEKIEKYKDGLILKIGPYSGLFLPQVWKEISNKESFLAHLCFKAGIPDPNCWKNRAAEIYKFRVNAFEEKEPYGEVIKSSL